MRNLKLLALLAMFTLGFPFGPGTSEADPSEPIVESGLDESVLKEAMRCLDLGQRWLTEHQSEDGSWSAPQYPALTGLAVITLCLDARRGGEESLPPSVGRGVAYILRCVREDGGIYISSEDGGGLPFYNTAICLTALSMVDENRYRDVIREAGRMLAASQHTGRDIFYGGFGYDLEADRAYADLSNTYIVLEAMRMAEQTVLQDEQEEVQQVALNWDAALTFLSRVQNLPESNDQPWAQSPREEDLGGFVYHPDESKAGEERRPDGSRMLHSYGSMSYAGLLSFIYAGVGKDDPRVVAAVDWIRGHYTVDENPGIGLEGLYYSYHTMAKALSHWGESPLKLVDGRSVWWRSDLTKQLITLQRIDPESGLGYWVNDNGRWWENDPVLATTYALMALEIAISPAVD